MEYHPKKAYREISGAAPAKIRSNRRLEVLTFEFNNLKTWFNPAHPLSYRTKFRVAIYFALLILSLTNSVFRIVAELASVSVILVIVLAAFGLWVFYDRHLNFKRAASRYRFDTTDPVVIDAITTLPAEGGSVDFADARVIQVPWLADAFSFSPGLDKELRAERINFVLKKSDEKKKRIRTALTRDAELWADILKAKWWRSTKKTRPQEFRNDKKICLCADPTLGKQQLEIFEGSYFLSFLTNELCSRDIVRAQGGLEKVVAAGIERFPFKAYWQEKETLPQLQSIENSLLSNHLGANVVAITADGLLCVWFQGERAQVSRNLLAPTGSGSLDWPDLVPMDAGKTYSLLDSVEKGMARELLEESTESGGHMSGDQVGFLRVLGYFRNIGRGGLPGFVGVARLNLDSGKVFPNKTETVEFEGKNKQTRFRANTKQELMESLATIMDTALYQRQLSLPLFANLYALREAMNDPDFANELFPE